MEDIYIPLSFNCRFIHRGRGDYNCEAYNNYNPSDVAPVGLGNIQPMDHFITKHSIYPMKVFYLNQKIFLLKLETSNFFQISRHLGQIKDDNIEGYFHKMRFGGNN